MDIFVAVMFAGVPLAWILYKFSSVPRAAVLHNRDARQADPVIRLRGRGTYQFAIVGPLVIVLRWRRFMETVRRTTRARNWKPSWC